MAKIEAINGLKKNQDLTDEEKQKLIRSAIYAHVKEEQRSAYKRGLTRSSNAICDLMREAG